jgi:prepilin-type N-terminal cleavage/methylation domain-containing protein
MKSKVNCQRLIVQRGFTLIELLISITILVVIFGLGLFISFDFYKNYAFRSEASVIVSILQKARSQSLNNISQTRHGVHFSSPLQYVIFECANSTCTSYTQNPSTDIVINPGYGVVVSNTPFDVVFNQLDGNCVTGCAAFTVTANGKTQTIDINSEGRISW